MSLQRSWGWSSFVGCWDKLRPSGLLFNLLRFVAIVVFCVPVFAVLDIPLKIGYSTTSSLGLNPFGISDGCRTIYAITPRPPSGFQNYSITEPFRLE